jgi:hypothetical protein
MNQYIITEEKLVKLQGCFHEQSLVKFFEIINDVFDHPYQSERDKVWIVAESRFEWYEVKHVCSSKEIALKRWEELRDELINWFQEMVEHCIKEDYHDADDWRKRIDTLKNLKPGESCDCDYPDLQEWGVELRQAGEP